MSSVANCSKRRCGGAGAAGRGMTGTTTKSLHQEEIARVREEYKRGGSNNVNNNSRDGGSGANKDDSNNKSNSNNNSSG